MVNPAYIVKLEDRNIVITAKRPFDQGAQAYRKGLEEWNPYKHNSPAWWQFNAGWQDASMEGQ